MTSNGTAIDTRSRVLSWIALGVVYLVWGSTYLAIRVGVGHLPPLLFAGTRYVIAGALLYPIALRATTSSRGSAKDRAKPGARAWFAGAIIGVLLLFAGNGGVTIGEMTLPSGFAAVLVATVPLWMILFAWPLQHQRVTFRSAVALAVGLGGVIILVGDGTASGRISGVIIVLGAAAAWGFGSVLSHRLAVPSHAMLAAAIEMLVGGVVLLAVGAGSGEFSRIQWSSVPATSWIALGYLIGPGSILAFTAYGYALSHLPLTTVSTYAYVNPVVAVLAGIIFLGEQFTWREGLGAALVLASVIITLHRSRSTSRPAPVRDGEMPEAEMLPGERRGTQREFLVARGEANGLVQAGTTPAGRRTGDLGLGGLGSGRGDAGDDALGHSVQQRQRAGDDAAGPVYVLDAGLDDLGVGLDRRHQLR
jgi:drug/metabolite transporter (DMT)-like permease